MKKYARKRKPPTPAAGADGAVLCVPDERGAGAASGGADGGPDEERRRAADAGAGGQGTSGRKKLRQLHIDVGQRNFGAVRCRLCGMVYTPGLEEDEALHAKLMCPYSKAGGKGRAGTHSSSAAARAGGGGGDARGGRADPFGRELVWPRLKVRRAARGAASRHRRRRWTRCRALG